MLLTDLNGPMSVQPRRSGLGRISRPVRFAAPAILFLSLTTFGAAVSRAQEQQDQSVAEAARQEHARKQELQKRARHVYTEEDLKHPNILTPEDRAQAEAKRNECAQKNNCSPGAPQNSPDALDANSQHQQPSLGEVARQLRKQKELQALKPKQSEPFHLSIGTPALASPVMPERSKIRRPTQPALHPRLPSNVFRRDPFSAVPVRPRAPVDVRPDVAVTGREEDRPNVRPSARSDFHESVRPTVRSRSRLVAPTQPKVFSLSAPPSTFVQPTQPAISARPLQPTVLAKPAQPVAPVATIRPIQPQRPLPATAIAEHKTVSVQRGDSLWKLAQENLGRGNRWPELLAANRWIADPNQIRAGAELNLPVPARVRVSTKKAGAKVNQTITVHRGDTLWNLAKVSFGRSSSWPCLAAANPSISDPDRIYENQQLLIPASCNP